jgi:hypothetical protein
MPCAPIEKCEWCGRFGAHIRRHKHPMKRGELMTLYLCNRCETKLAEQAAAGLARLAANGPGENTDGHHHRD